MMPHPGDILKERCQQRGLSYDMLVQQSGISNVRRLVSGRNRFTLKTSIALGKVLGMGPQDLLNAQERYYAEVNS